MADNESSSKYPYRLLGQSSSLCLMWLGRGSQAELFMRVHVEILGNSELLRGCADMACHGPSRSLVHEGPRGAFADGSS